MSVGGYAYHVLNRGNGRMTIFEDEDDFAAFERVLEEAADRFPGVDVLAYCLMPNHWHLVLYPHQDGQLSAFVGWLTLTHTQRWRAHRHTIGGGHVYQGRFKSFLVDTEGYLANVCRYVERNPVRAGIVKQAENWWWSSLRRWHQGSAEANACWHPGQPPEEGGRGIGSSASTRLRHKPNWMRCGLPAIAGNHLATRRGKTVSSNSSVSNQPFANAVGRRRTIEFC